MGMGMYGSSDDDDDDEEKGAAAQGQASSNKKRERPAPTPTDLLPPALPDPDFFHVSPEHVYTTVLTNGQRRKVQPKYGKHALAATSTSSTSSSSSSAAWVRSVPHIEGNWATHVYIRVPNTTEVLRLAHACVNEGRKRLQGVLADGKEGLVVNDLTPEDSDASSSSEDEEGGGGRGGKGEHAQHISLSRTVYLRSHLIEPFVADLRKALAWACAFTVGLGGGFGLLVNDERTRSFLTVPVEGGEERLKKLVESVDQVLAHYRQPAYYSDPSFHLSVASVLGDVTGAWTKGKREGQEEEEEEEEEEGTSVYVDTIKCRIGHKLFSISLREEG